VIVPELAAAVETPPTQFPEYVTVATGEHARHCVSPALDFCAAAQELQDALPMVDLYVPTIQAAHGPAAGPLYPPLQPQAARAELAIADVVSAGQVKHVVAAVEVE